MSISATIRDAIIRHVLQALGSAMVTGGLISASQQAAIEPLVISVVGGVISIFSIWWAGRASTDASIITAAVESPSVVRDQTTIVVTDPKIAAKTPAEVVYGHDVSIQ